eukprot:gene12805-7075_t
MMEEINEFRRRIEMEEDIENLVKLKQKKIWYLTYDKNDFFDFESLKLSKKIKPWSGIWDEDIDIENSQKEIKRITSSDDEDNWVEFQWSDDEDRY